MWRLPNAILFGKTETGEEGKGFFVPGKGGAGGCHGGVKVETSKRGISVTYVKYEVVIS